MSRSGSQPANDTSVRRSSHRTRPGGSPLRFATFGVISASLVLAFFATSAGAQTTGQTPPQFATGSVTSIDGSSLQVSNQNNETTVVVAGTTTFTKRETGTASAIAVGDCVVATGTGSAAKGIKAANVSVTPASSTGCTGAGRGLGGGAGRFGGTGRRPNFGNGEAPSGGTGQRPNFGNRPKNFGIAFGPVQSVSGDKMVVKATTITPAAAKQSTKNTKPKTMTKNVTVTLSSSTTISQTVAASAADLSVGSCVTARGPLVSGAVNATTVAISSPVNGACTAGFGGGFGGFGRGGNGGGTGTTTSTRTTAGTGGSV